MPGSGKSTIGDLLAKRLSYGFVDSDKLIQEIEGCSLQHIIDKRGYEVLCTIEENVLCNLKDQKHVIATGGSAVYSRRAMGSLKQKGILVFLDVDLPKLKERLDDYENRGIVKRPGQNLEDLYNDRYPLYRKYADMTITCTDMTQKEILDEIIASIAKKTDKLKN